MTTFAPDLYLLWVQITYKVNGRGWYYASDLPESAAHGEKGCSGERDEVVLVVRVQHFGLPDPTS